MIAFLDKVFLSFRLFELQGSSNGSIVDTLRDVLSQVAAEAVQLLPRIFIALIILAIAFAVAKALNYGLRRVLKFTDIDELFTRVAGFTLPLKFDALIIFLTNLGIVLVAFYAVVNLFVEPQYLQIINDGFYYGARIISIVAISIILLAIFNMLIGRIRVENRLRSYAMLIVLLLITAMLVDLTALSDPVKQALTTGLSIGVGIAIGVFAFWFFFHPYIDRIVKNRYPNATEEEKMQDQHSTWPEAYGYFLSKFWVLRNLDRCGIGNILLTNNSNF